MQVSHIILGKFIDRFRSTCIVRPGTRCWMWSSDKDRKGYGRVYVENRRMPAHRVSWEIFCGAIPTGLSVLHKCDSPACVNPEHLYLGTQKDNVKDMWAKGRNGGNFVAQTRCKNGHEFNEANIVKRKDKHRSCRICLNAWKRKWRLERRQ